MRLEERLEGERSLILRQLTRHVGALPDSARSHIDTLAISQLEALGEALLDFSNLDDLEAWLMQQGSRQSHIDPAQLEQSNPFVARSLLQPHSS